MIFAIAVALFLTPTRRLGWSLAASAITFSAILTTIQFQSNLGSDFGEFVDTPGGQKVWAVSPDEIIIAAGVNFTLGLAAAALVAGLVLAFRRLHN
ncbi:MAG: hypothetical protein ABL866_06020 [Devosia sp.]